MHSFGTGVFKRQQPAQNRRGTLRAAAAVMLTLISGVPSGFAQQSANPARTKASSGLPAAPEPVATSATPLRQSQHDFSQPKGDITGKFWKMYSPTDISAASFVNSVRLDNLVKDGKIYLSLSDAIALAIENNYDIAIARYNLDIADTDVLRSKAGSALRGVNSGVVANTLGGGGSTLVSGGGPGGTTGGSGGAASGAGGLVTSTQSAGPLPEIIDPSLTGTVQFDHAKQLQTNTLFSAGEPVISQNTNTYNFAYNQGFVTGTALQVGFNNSRAASDLSFNSYSPLLQSSFKASLTQHLLQGFGIFVNKRFMYQAENNRKITDSSFRQQILYTTNQVENIYWGLVSAYEDVQAKERALAQSTQLESDTRKQLDIGTMAPLDVVNAQSTVATDKQGLINSRNILQYQQLVMKQAIARNLNDPALVAAPIVPTDRISLEELPEEKTPVDELVQTAFKQRPELEQAVLTLKNDAIGMKGTRNALLPVFDVQAYYGGSGVGGAQSPYLNCNPVFGGKFIPCPAGLVPSVGYGDVLHQLVDSAGPDKGVAFSLNIPLRNRPAQADQARSVMEYRQSELRLEQLYTQIRMQVVNAQFALTNDRAQVLASRAAHDYATQSLDAEQKKLHLGASTTTNVLQYERSLATAENNLIAAEAAYAKDRAGLYQTLATTLQHYGINMNDAASGTVSAVPNVPGMVPATNQNVAPTAPAPTGR
ncbi:TolC family protein [Occallatibacter riparius]|uniref:TolC family protein n=1 Tax=Occallatibacter riparius TaxID=1002689 RepID=A0A9J7BQT2_9BACT|nr:TolC family protein [Occallatibacter riparius]UWZ83453.1 TolC family protein [Occallatibacter riparius]